MTKFTKMTFGLPMVEFCLMLGCGEKNPDVYTLNWVHASAARPRVGWLRWPAEFILANFHRKHVLHTSRLPRLSLVADGLRNFVHRVCWRIALADAEGSPWHRLRSKKLAATPFRGELPSDIMTLLEELSQTVLEKCRKARVQHLRRRVRIPGIYKFALTFFSGSWGALPTDKDGGYCLLPKVKIREGMLDLLEGPAYHPVLRSSTLCEDVIDDYIAVSSQIAGDLKDRGLKFALLSDIDTEAQQRVFQQLQVNVKTHKPVGKVTFRAIHSSACSALKPGMRYISWCLQPALARIPWLLRDSFDFVERLRRRTFPSNTIMIRLDIREFFMTGRHDDILSSCSGVVTESHQKSFGEMCRFVLGSQYVVPPFPTEEAYKVSVGTGMGLSCSGDLSNICFYVKAEKGYVDSVAVRSECLVWEYLRYMDDVWMAAHDGPGWHKFVSELVHRASPFEVQIEETSKESVQMLDLRVYAGGGFQRCHKFDFEVSPKSSSIATPLMPTSCHPPSVHMSWPSSLVQRWKHLSSSRLGNSRALDHFGSLWTRFQLYPRTTTSERRDRQPQLRIVLPFSPVWGGAGLGGALREFEGRFQYVTSGLQLPGKFGIAWRLGGSNLFSTLRGTLRVIDEEAPKICR